MSLSGLVAIVLIGQATGDAATERVATQVVTIEQGRLRGFVQEDVHVFRGIPYAAPPVDDKRWRAPQPPSPWEGVRDCFTFGPACPQRNIPLQRLVPLGAIESFREDCLNLNIYRPAHPKSEKLPVMVWIHGGGFGEGANSMRIYDGSSLAAKGAVVVVINYRLGPFGLFAHPHLTNEAGTSGNYGILDQIESLRWVKKNIEAFGGDPHRVTIFGESAGGGSVVCLLVSPLAEGLFQRAIIQSSPDMAIRHLKETVRGKPSAEAVGSETAKKCGIREPTDTRALREIDADDLLKHFPALNPVGQAVSLSALKLPAEPCVDGVVIVENPCDSLKNGRFHRVPVMVGTMRDEAALFLWLAKLPTRKDEFDAIVRREFGRHADSFIAAYSAANEPRSLRRQIAEMMTDLVFGEPSRHLARSSSAWTRQTYRFLFSRGSRIPFLATAGAHHGLDVPYVFGSNDPVWNWTDWDRELSDKIQSYWVNFATTGDPNGDGLPRWPAYDAGAEQILEFGDTIHVIERYRHEPHDTVEAYLRERDS